jgi:DNA excision repair protein ERCC-1
MVDTINFNPLTLLVNENQKKNPLLKYINELRIDYATILPDYLVDDTKAFLFLSLEFHRLKPEYIVKRLATLQKNQYPFQFLLCLIDLNDFEETLRNVTVTAFNMGFILLPAWTPKEAACHIQSIKQLSNKSSDSIQQRPSEKGWDQIVSILTTIPSITTVDAMCLMRHFKTLRQLFRVIHITYMNRYD